MLAEVLRRWEWSGPRSPRSLADPGGPRRIGHLWPVRAGPARPGVADGTSAAAHHRGRSSARVFAWDRPRTPTGSWAGARHRAPGAARRPGRRCSSGSWGPLPGRSWLPAGCRLAVVRHRPRHSGDFHVRVPPAPRRWRRSSRPGGASCPRRAVAGRGPALRVARLAAEPGCGCGAGGLRLGTCTSATAQWAVHVRLGGLRGSGPRGGGAVLGVPGRCCLVGDPVRGQFSVTGAAPRGAVPVRRGGPSAATRSPGPWAGRGGPARPGHQLTPHVLRHAARRGVWRGIGLAAIRSCWVTGGCPPRSATCTWPRAIDAYQQAAGGPPHGSG